MNVVDMSSPPPSEETFTAFYREYYRSVHGYIRATCSGIDAAEAAESVFMIAWRRFDHIPAEYPKAWLFGVVRNVIRNERRTQRRSNTLVERAVFDRPHTSTSQADDAVPPEVLDGLVAGLNRLRDDDREILLLSAWGGLDADEIATTLGIKKNAATVRLHRARERLRTTMGNRTGDQEGRRTNGAA